MVMSMVTVVTLFKYLMLPNEEGVFNYIIGVLGFEPSLWLNGTGTARESVVFIAVWKGIGYNVILFFAGLQGIPADMYEAAEIDGANSFKKCLYNDTGFQEYVYLRIDHIDNCRLKAFYRGLCGEHGDRQSGRQTGDIIAVYL